jgi:hypothetical protein
MWLAIALWWLFCAVVFVALQRRVGCIDTYQAIWGLDQTLPGYRRQPIGLGVVRLAATDAAPWRKRGAKR